MQRSPARRPCTSSLPAYEEGGTLDDTAPRRTQHLPVSVTACHLLVKAAGSNLLPLPGV